MRGCSDPSVPCHRVVAAGGALGGYGGRDAMKRALLAAEGVQVREGRVRGFTALRWAPGGPATRLPRPKTRHDLSRTPRRPAPYPPPGRTSRARMLGNEDQRGVATIPSKVTSDTRSADIELAARLREGDVHGIRGPVPPPRTAAVQPGVPHAGRPDRRRGPAAGDVPAGVPAHRQLQGRRRARHVALSAGHEPLPRPAAQQGRARRTARRRRWRTSASARLARARRARRRREAASTSSARSRVCPTRCRAAFLLHDVEGFEHREVGTDARRVGRHVEVAGAQGAAAACGRFCSRAGPTPRGRQEAARIMTCDDSSNGPATSSTATSDAAGARRRPSAPGVVRRVPRAGRRPAPGPAGRRRRSTGAPCPPGAWSPHRGAAGGGPGVRQAQRRRRRPTRAARAAIVGLAGGCGSPGARRRRLAVLRA